MCSYGGYIVGVQAKYESMTAFSAGDDTALNNLRIICLNPNGSLQGITLGYGYFGDWIPYVNLVTNYITGLSVKWEDN